MKSKCIINIPYEWCFQLKTTICQLLLLLQISCFSLIAQDHTTTDHQTGAINPTENYERVLKNRSKYSIEEVNKAFQKKFTRLMFSNPDTLLSIFEDQLEYLLSMDEKILAGEATLSQAEIFYMSGQIDKALERLCAGLDLLPDDHHFVHETYARFASIYLNKVQLDSAIYYADKFEENVLRYKDTVNYVNAYQIQGELAVAQNRYVTGLDYYFKALKWADKALIPMRKADVFQKIASIYVALDDDDNAKTYLESALAITQDNAYSRMEAVLKLRLSHYEIRKKNYSKAKKYLLDSEEYFISKKMFNQAVQSRSMLAMINISQDRIDLAEYYLESAEELLDLIGIDQAKYSYYQVKGMYNEYLGRYDEAIKNYKRAIDLSSKPVKANSLFSSMKSLIALYSEKGDTDSELEYTKRYYQLKDSLFNLKQRQLIYDYEGRYKKSEQELAITALNEANALQALKIESKSKQLWIRHIECHCIAIANINKRMDLHTKEKNSFGFKK